MQIHFQWQVFLLRPKFRDADGLTDQDSDIGRPIFELQVFGFELGKVQHPVKQLQQRVGTGDGNARQLGILGLEPGAPQQFHAGKDCIHRRADFMTHDRQQHGLVPLAAPGLTLGLMRAVQQVRKDDQEQHQHQQFAQIVIQQFGQRRRAVAIGVDPLRHHLIGLARGQ